MIERHERREIERKLLVLVRNLEKYPRHRVEVGIKLLPADLSLVKELSMLLALGRIVREELVAKHAIFVADRRSFCFQLSRHFYALSSDQTSELRDRRTSGAVFQHCH